MQTQPGEQHAWLRRWVGEWSVEGEMYPAPGAEPIRSKGAEVVRPLGDLWIIGESEGTMPGGGSYSALLTAGFNPKTGRFVGSWIGSMSGYLWVYDGWLGGDELTLEAQGESCLQPGTMTTYRDITRLVSDNERRFRATLLNPDGQWQEIMSLVYRRTK